MAAHGARRLKRMNENLSVILGIEAMCAVQGIEARAPLQTSEPLRKAVQAFRAKVERLQEDRYMADDIKATARLLASDALAKASGVTLSL